MNLFHWFQIINFLLFGINPIQHLHPLTNSNHSTKNCTYFGIWVGSIELENMITEEKK